MIEVAGGCFLGLNRESSTQVGHENEHVFVQKLLGNFWAKETFPFVASPT